MRIERLEIAGFKSFAEPVTLEFGQGATAVVGPNGCGKSNIADAIFWVLGELGAGAIRARGKELIFSGSALREPLGVAEVRLHVSGARGPGPGASGTAPASNGVGHLPSVGNRSVGNLSAANGASPPLDAPAGSLGENGTLGGRPDAGGSASGLPGEVVVSRRVDASGQSVYEMDGRRCTRRSIRRLFAGTGLGPGSYALIEQGRANEVLSRKPADLRLLIEEAIGLGAYRMNRRESEGNLRAAEKALERVRERLAELDRYIRVARRDSRTASRVRDASETARRLAVAEQAARREELRARLRENVAPEDALSAERDRRSRSLLAFERFVETIRERVAGTEVELREATREIGDLGARRARAIALLDEGARAAGVRASQVSRLEAEAATLDARLVDLATERQEGARRAGEFPRRLAELTEAAKERATARDRVLVEEREAHAAVWELRRETDRLRASVRSFRLSLEQCARRRERLTTAGLDLAKSRSELDAQGERATREHTEAASRVGKQETEVARLAKEREVTEASWRSAIAGAEAAREEEARAARSQVALSERLRSLRALIASREQLGEGASKLVEAAERRGVALGGAVGELVQVDPGYELAAERLLGVHGVRVDRVCEVMELVEELGGGEAGFSEVVVSELLDVFGPPERPSAGEGDRLRDHLKPADPGLDSAIPNAVVTAQLPEALGAFLRKPGLYVTRDGASVAPPGVVRFGRGGPGEGFLSTRREVAELEVEEQQAKRRLARRSRACVTAAEAADRAGRAAEEIRGALGRAENQVVRLRLEAARQQENVGDVRKRIKELEAELSRHGEELASTERDEARAAQQLDGDNARLEAASRALSEREAAHAVLRRDLEDRERRWREADRELARQHAVADEVTGRAEALDRHVREHRQRLERARAESAAARREEEEWLVRRESAKEARRSADAAIAEWEAREQVVSGAASGLRERLERAAAAARVRGLELRELEERLHQTRSETREVQGLVRELEKEFRRAQGRSLDEAAGALPPALCGRSREDIAEELGQVRDRIEALGPINEVAEARLRELQAERREPEGHLRDVEQGITDGLAAIRRQDREARRIFSAGFGAVSAGFDEAFRQLFGGGQAKLRLVEIADRGKDESPDENGSGEDAAGVPGDRNPAGEPAAGGAFHEVETGSPDWTADWNGNGASLAPKLPADAHFGVEIAAQPPGKKLQSVRLLSGGEKAMTAIAFLIALFRNRPAPFCLLDEVDAPLDDANVQRFASMLGELKQDTQLVVITHNRLTIEACEHLYGVTMEEPGVSRLLSVQIGAELDGWIGAAADAEPAGAAIPMHG